MSSNLSSAPTNTCLLAIVLLFISMPLISSELRPFSSDGCSAFPDGTREQKKLWLNCCIAHDFSYWKGGTYQDRLKADKALEQCVNKVGKPEIALLMLAGVRVGGTPFLPTSFRWGYGWPYPKLYGPLNKSELDQVKKVVKQQED